MNNLRGLDGRVAKQQSTSRGNGVVASAANVADYSKAIELADPEAPSLASSYANSN